MTTEAANDLLNQQVEMAQQSNKFRPPKRGVSLSKSTGIEYNAKLQKIVKEIKKDINRLIMPLVRELIAIGRLGKV